MFDHKSDQKVDPKIDAEKVMNFDAKNALNSFSKKVSKKHCPQRAKEIQKDNFMNLS